MTVPSSAPPVRWATVLPVPDPLAPGIPPGVHRLRSRWSTSALRPRLERNGWATSVVDLVGAPDKPAILEAFASGLAFPAWVGRNWDALDDALRDLSWWPSGSRGRVLIIRGAGRLATGTPRDREVLLAVLTNAALRWSSSDTPLVVLLRR
jgi:hypothetical protein